MNYDIVPFRLHHEYFVVQRRTKHVFFSRTVIYSIFKQVSVSLFYSYLTAGTIRTQFIRPIDLIICNIYIQSRYHEVF